MWVGATVTGGIGGPERIWWTGEAGEAIVSEESVGKAAVSAFGIFLRPFKRLCTQDTAGALHAEADRCALSVSREFKTEIPAISIEREIEGSQRRHS